MKKILAFGASNSKNSINKTLASWAAQQIEGAEANVIDLNDFDMPVYSMDIEQESGIPQAAHDFKTQIREADGIIISFAEHNGSFSAAYKNVADWASRVEKVMWLDKPVFLMATSPGARGGITVLEHAANIIPHRGAKVLGSFSLPSFQDNFDEGIKEGELKENFDAAIADFKKEVLG